MKKLLLKTIFIITATFFTLLFATNPIFWWLFATSKPNKTHEELIEDTKHILEKYIEDIKSFLGLNEIPEIRFTRYDEKEKNIAKFSYLRKDSAQYITRKYFSNILGLNTKPIILIDGITDGSGYDINISICTDKIYSLKLIMKNPILYRIRILSIITHELTHYSQFKRNELQTIEYVPASANYSLYIRQPVEVEANKMGRLFIMKNFIKILRNK